MGIKDLWSILQPYCERKPLFELQNKRVAIDLSGWVCQAQCIADYQVQPKMYLRNLYFRTCFLLLQDVQLVFVLEGQAPTLKYKTIAARNELQFKGAKPRNAKTTMQQTDDASANVKEKKKKSGRSRFDFTLKQCKQMLGLMGLACVTGQGEAEAMCAYLNQQNCVEGCISQDSDCFAYGARIVYRNFSISMQGNQASSGGSVDVYDLAKAERKMDFGRNKIIALALICGSDYNEGVPGVGKESALKLFNSCSDADIMERLRAWRSQDAHYKRIDLEINDKNKCATCGHQGKKAAHTRAGCQGTGCRTVKGCTPNERHLSTKHELQLRSKALLDEAFPDEELIGEFMLRNEDVSDLQLQWTMPNIVEFINFTCKHLQWEEIYAFEKFLPILTRWIVHNPGAKNAPTVPDYIKKARAPKGIASYEIVWTHNQFTALIPKEQLANVDEIKVFATIEPQDIVDRAFPGLVQRYKDSKVKVKVPKTKRTKKNTKKPRTMKDFVVQTTIDDSLLGDDDATDDVDLSLVIDDIVARGVPLVFKQKVNQLLAKGTGEVWETNFFDFCPNDGQVDAFERSLCVRNDDSSSASSSDGET